MIFSHGMADQVLAGAKTVTRRKARGNPRSPWWRDGCRLTVGNDYAVQNGRGQKGLGRIRVESIDLTVLGFLSPAEARREGFDGPDAFQEAWRLLHGRYDPTLVVWRVEFVCYLVGPVRDLLVHALHPDLLPVDRDLCQRCCSEAHGDVLDERGWCAVCRRDRVLA